MELNTYHLSEFELEHLDGLLKENRNDEAREYIISTQIDYLEKIIQAHLHGYWYIRIKYGKKEEELIQIADKRMEELKAICPSPVTFVVWEDFNKNIICSIFDSYSDFKEWSEASYIFRILDVLWH